MNDQYGKAGFVLTVSHRKWDERMVLDFEHFSLPYLNETWAVLVNRGVVVIPDLVKTLGSVSVFLKYWPGLSI